MYTTTVHVGLHQASKLTFLQLAQWASSPDLSCPCRHVCSSIYALLVARFAVLPAPGMWASFKCEPCACIIINVYNSVCTCDVCTSGVLCSSTSSLGCFLLSPLSPILLLLLLHELLEAVNVQYWTVGGGRRDSGTVLICGQ